VIAAQVTKMAHHGYASHLVLLSLRRILRYRSAGRRELL
jgi:hypothetical protein